MTEITQADRDAVKAYYVETGFVADQKGLEQAFARHRMEERAAIVAWLRGSRLISDHILADHVEAGDHLK